MGHRYFASVTFPAAAREIAAVQAVLSADATNMEDLGDTIIVCDEQSSDGELDIIAVLEEHQVPYNHCHQDDLACDEWTVCVRFDRGVRKEYTDSSEVDARLELARTLKPLLDAGDITAVQACLCTVLAEDAPSLDGLAATWVPTPH